MLVEDVMYKFEDYLDNIIPLLIIRVENEEFEEAVKIKKDIDNKINNLVKFIIKNELSLLKEEDIEIELYKRKHNYMNEWYDVFNIEENKRAVFI
jgi:hypothetical protein